MTTATIRRVDGKDARFYDTPGGRYPSVTTILSCISKPALIPWARNTALESVRQVLLDIYNKQQVAHRNESGGFDDPWLLMDEERIAEIIATAKKRPDEIKDTAADRGTRAHAAIEAYIKGQRGGFEPDCEWAVLNFSEWLDKSGLTIVATERMVWSAKLRAAGTMDFAAVDKLGTRWVGDLKTGNALYVEAKAQVAAYADMYDGGLADKTCILRVGKDKEEFEVWESPNWRADLNGFLAARDLWEWLNKKPAKEIANG